jgi:hypothetical protein
MAASGKSGLIGELTMCGTVGDSTTYEIRVRGHIDSRWSDWFAGLTIRTTLGPDGVPITILTGEVVDQSALSGILVRLSDMNLPLISVNPTDDSPLVESW